MARLVWSSDIHLDHAEQDELVVFFESVRESGADLLVISGDISGGSTLPKWLNKIESELAIPVRFVLGNHDFYSSSFQKTYEVVRKAINKTSKAFNGSKRLVWLSDNIIETISKETALIGHDGWYDGRAGIIGSAMLNDFMCIEDLKSALMKSVLTFQCKLKEIADQAASYIKITLEKAFTIRNKVIMATHISPFPQATLHRGAPTNVNFLPYYCCVSMGRVLVDTMNNNKDKELVVLCGHTHGECEVNILPNLKVLVAGAEYGYPKLCGMMEV